MYLNETIRRFKTTKKKVIIIHYLNYENVLIISTGDFKIVIVKVKATNNAFYKANWKRALAE